LPRKFGKGRKNEDAKISHSVFGYRETEENENFDIEKGQTSKGVRLGSLLQFSVLHFFFFFNEPCHNRVDPIMTLTRLSQTLYFRVVFV
jgi:hypothetical protein